MKAKTAAEARTLEQIPNIGKSIAGDLRAIGISEPRQLIGRDPYLLYEQSNAVAGVRQDPCLIDCFISAVRFMEGGPPRVWWDFTAERKARPAGIGEPPYSAASSDRARPQDPPPRDAPATVGDTRRPRAP